MIFLNLWSGYPEVPKRSSVPNPRCHFRRKLDDLDLFVQQAPVSTGTGWLDFLVNTFYSRSEYLSGDLAIIIQ
jgi:hypothetical protein